MSNAMVIAQQGHVLGRRFTLVEPGTPTYDETTDTGTPGVPISHSVVGNLRTVDARYVDGIDVKASDSMIVLGAGDVPEPAVGWRLEAGSRSWTVVQVRKHVESFGASADWDEDFAGWTLIVRGAG